MGRVPTDRALSPARIRDRVCCFLLRHCSISISFVFHFCARSRFPKGRRGVPPPPVPESVCDLCRARTIHQVPQKFARRASVVGLRTVGWYEPVALRARLAEEPGRHSHTVETKEMMRKIKGPRLERQDETKTKQNETHTHKSKNKRGRAGNRERRWCANHTSTRVAPAAFSGFPLADRDDK